MNSENGGLWSIRPAGISEGATTAVNAAASLVPLIGTASILTPDVGFLSVWSGLTGSDVR